MKNFEIFRDVIVGPWNTSGEDVQWKTLLIDDTPYLVFQGSNSDIDWRNNFRFAVVVYKNQESKLLAHRGFVRAWKSCNDEVMNSFIELCNKTDKTPIITGHSFGGAMSVLASEDFYYRTKRKTNVITFGAPKVLWGKDSVNYVLTCADFTMYSQNNDIVPKCPPICGYKHPNQTMIGDKFNIFKLIKTADYHQLYDVESEFLK